MDLKPQDDGRWHVSLGVVEKRIVFFGATLLTLAVGYVFNSAMQQLKATSAGIVNLNQQMGIVQNQLQTMNTQLADVPALKLEVAKHAVEIEQAKSDIKELKQTRGLK